MAWLTLHSSLKPLIFLSVLAGVYTLPFRRKNKKLLSLLKVLSNIVFPLLSCGTLLTQILAEIYFLAESERIQTVSSFHRFCFLFGELHMLITFSTNGSGSLRRFLKAFERHQSSFKREDIGFKFVLGIGIVLALLATVQQVFVSMTGTSFGDHRDMVSAPRSYTTTSFILSQINRSRIAVHVSQYTISQIFMSGFILYLSVWRLLIREARDLMKQLKEDPAALMENPDVLENFRLRHMDICELIGLANKFVRHILATLYGAGLPSILLVIHGFVYKQLSKEEFLNMAFFFICLVGSLITVTLTGVFLNVKMHEPTDFLFKLKVGKMPGKGTEVIAVFLSKLQGAPIGFNVYNLFTLDPSTILMICGTILTYAVVIIQLRPSEDREGLSNDSQSPATLNSSLVHLPIQS